MIPYIKLLNTRILHRKANIFLIISSIFILLVILAMNIREQHILLSNFASQVETTNNEIEKYTMDLSSYIYESDEYLRYENHIESLKSQLQAYEMLIQYYDNKDWTSFYNEYSNELNMILQIVENSHIIGENEDMGNYTNKQLAYIKYLDAHDLTYEELGFPIVGLSFITNITKEISPILILFCCIFILTQIFTMDYAKSIDISNLFPIGRIKAFLVKLIVGIVTSVLIFTLILGITFLISALINFNTGFQYPIMIQDAATNIWHAIPLTTFLKDWIMLGISFYMSVCFFTYLLSLFIKEEGPLFFTSLCIILGVTYLPTFLPEMAKIAHYLPTTYMNFVSVSTGELAIRYGNMDISFTSGIQVISIFILAIFLLCFIIKYVSAKIVHNKFL